MQWNREWKRSSQNQLIQTNLRKYSKNIISDFIKINLWIQIKYHWLSLCFRRQERNVLKLKWRHSSNLRKRKSKLLKKRQQTSGKNFTLNLRRKHKRRESNIVHWWMEQEWRKWMPEIRQWWRFIQMYQLLVFRPNIKFTKWLDRMRNFMKNCSRISWYRDWLNYLNMK